MKRTLSSHARPLLAVAVMAVVGVATAQTTGSGMGSTGATGTPGSTTPKMGTTGTTPGTTDQRSGTDTSIGSGTSSVGSSVGPNAGTGASSPATTFRSLDTNNRGYLQRGDVSSVQGFSFDQADMNHDGRISQDEFARWQSTNQGSPNRSGMSNNPAPTPNSNMNAPRTNSGTSSGQGGSSGTTK